MNLSVCDSGGEKKGWGDGGEDHERREREVPVLRMPLACLLPAKWLFIPELRSGASIWLIQAKANQTPKEASRWPDLMQSLGGEQALAALSMVLSAPFPLAARPWPPRLQFRIPARGAVGAAGWGRGGVTCCRRRRRRPGKVPFDRWPAPGRTRPLPWFPRRPRRPRHPGPGPRPSGHGLGASSARRPRPSVGAVHGELIMAIEGKRRPPAAERPAARGGSGRRGGRAAPEEARGPVSVPGGGGRSGDAWPGLGRWPRGRKSRTAPAGPGLGPPPLSGCAERGSLRGARATEGPLFSAPPQRTELPPSAPPAKPRAGAAVPFLTLPCPCSGAGVELRPPPVPPLSAFMGTGEIGLGGGTVRFVLLLNTQNCSSLGDGG